MYLFVQFIEYLELFFSDNDCYASIAQAKSKCCAENKWVIVNILSHEDFHAQEMNRDTWVEETIRSLLTETFLFYQRGHTTYDAKDFMRYYRVTEDMLPYIAIIEPNTGAKLASWVVSITMLVWF